MKTANRASKPLNGRDERGCLRIDGKIACPMKRIANWNQVGFPPNECRTKGQWSKERWKEMLGASGHRAVWEAWLEVLNLSVEEYAASNANCLRWLEDEENATAEQRKALDLAEEVAGDLYVAFANLLNTIESVNSQRGEARLEQTASA